MILALGHCRGKNLGVVGYGDIGQSAARIARAFRMNILALRRRTELSKEEEEEGLKVRVCSPRTAGLFGVMLTNSAATNTQVSVVTKGQAVMAL